MIYQEAQHRRAQAQLNPDDVEWDDKGGEEQEQDGASQTIAQDDEEMLHIARVRLHHKRREDLHQQEHHKRAHRGIGVPEHHILILDTDHEIDHHRHTREEDGTRHSLTIKHQEESRIHQSRTRLSLPYDTNHRKDDNRHRREEVFRIADVETIVGHKLSHRQCRGKLSKLSRLQS